MKKFGLVGGVGPLSTLAYYKGITEGYWERTGLLASPPMTIESLDYGVVENSARMGDYTTFAECFISAVNVLHVAGAEFCAIAANTAHLVLPQLKEHSPIPIVSILEATASQAHRMKTKKAILFGTVPTIKSGMFDKPFADYGMEIICPDEDDQLAIDRILFPNLEKGVVLWEQKEQLLLMVRRLQAEYGADTLILGCTELPLAIKSEDLSINLLDTTQAHINAILDMLLAS